MLVSVSTSTFAAAEKAGSFVELDVPVAAWLALAGAIGILLAVDLVAHRGHTEPTPKRAAVESAIWITIGLAFTGVMAWSFGGQAAGEYLSGYLVEKSLSVDNVFVWAIIFSSFAIPLQYQHRVLFWGIFGALVLRGIFVFAGVALIDRFWWLLVVFGAFLVVTGIRVVRHRADEGTHGHDRAVRFLERFMPVTKRFDGARFFTVEGARRVATPLFAALVVVEFTDVIFAVDSVPAVLSVSHEPFIVLSSNAFAILGLRAAYFLLAGWKERLHYLGHGLGAILVFVGAKMVAARWWHLPTSGSLLVIVSLLALAVILSLRHTRRNGGGGQQLDDDGDLGTVGSGLRDR